MALSADRKLEYKEGVLLPVPVKAAEEIYGGALVAVDADGYLVAGADTAGLIFQGVANERKTGGAASGDESCIVRRRGVVKCAIAAATQANVGDNVFLVDDETVGLAATTDNDIYCGIIAGYIDATHVWVDIEPAIRQADVATHIADTDGAHAASAVSILDSGGFTSQDEVESALAELYPKAPVAIADPGDEGAIPVTRSALVPITTAGAETRTLAIPALAGISVVICGDVLAGACTITVAAAINQTGNDTIVIDAAGETIVLTAVQVAGGLVWRAVENDGCTLSTA